MPFQTIEQVLAAMRGHGATRLLYKILSANDNTKQQVYLGGNFDVVRVLPAGKMTENGEGKRVRLKAPLDYWWVTDSGDEKAESAQLILYPQYPEVRLSGFLRGCRAAPSKLMDPNLRSAGRVLFFGITGSRIYAILVAADSPIASEALNLAASKAAANVASIFYEIPLPKLGLESARTDLLKRLRAIYKEGWIASFRLNAKGQAVPCNSRNCGGFTLEGKFNIIPNSKSEPDFRGWELKAFSDSKITLLTPEPTLGFYGESGVAAFLNAYGRRSTLIAGRKDFTGLHRVGKKNTTTGMKLVLVGYDPATGKIDDASGGLHLIDRNGGLAAGWSFVDLLNHWRSKHTQTAFVRYKHRTAPSNEYCYGPKIYLASGAPFPRYLAGLNSGVIYYDPAPKSEEVGGKVKTKARNQFRTDIACINQIFTKVEELELG